jgi:hypothetical protein
MEKLDQVRYKYNGKTEWDEIKDSNLVNRHQILQALYPIYKNDHKQLIRFLLEQEITYAQEYGYTSGLNVASFMLYTIMSIDDVPLLFDSKFNSCGDARFALDIELIFGLDKDETKDYFMKNPAAERPVVEVIKEYEGRPFKTREQFLSYYTTRRIETYLDELILE